MKSVEIIIPDNCEECPFMHRNNTDNNNGPDYDSKYTCMLVDKLIAQEQYLKIRDAFVNPILHTINFEEHKWIMCLPNTKTVWDGKSPQWCPANEKVKIELKPDAIISFKWW